MKLERYHGRLFFWCPGCNESHQITSTAQGGGWTVDVSNPSAPTVTPSVLVESGHFGRGAAPGNCWCDMEQRLGIKSTFKCYRCHSFITAGRIQFLDDCSHDLAGQTVDLPDWPADGFKR